MMQLDDQGRAQAQAAADAMPASAGPAGAPGRDARLACFRLSLMRSACNPERGILDRGREDPPHAGGQEEAADVPRRRGRRPLAPRRPLHRDHRPVRAPPGAVGRRDRRRAGAGLAAQGRPADRAGAEAARRPPACGPSTSRSAASRGAPSSPAAADATGKVDRRRSRRRRPRPKAPGPAPRHGRGAGRRSPPPPTNRPPRRPPTKRPQPTKRPARRCPPSTDDDDELEDERRRDGDVADDDVDDDFEDDDRGRESAPRATASSAPARRAVVEHVTRNARRRPRRGRGRACERARRRGRAARARQPATWVASSASAVA